MLSGGGSVVSRSKPGLAHARALRHHSTVRTKFKKEKSDAQILYILILINRFRYEEGIEK